MAASDAIQTGDLVRFFDNGLPALDASQFNYIDSLAAEIAIENKLGSQSTSLYSKNGNKSTVDLFHAPSYLELHGSSSTSQSTNSGTETSTTTSTSSSAE